MQTWKQACPICLGQGLRQRWGVARGLLSSGDSSRAEQKTRNPLTEVSAACPAVNQGGEGVAEQMRRHSLDGKASGDNASAGVLI